MRQDSLKQEASGNSRRRLVKVIKKKRDKSIEIKTVRSRSDGESTETLETIQPTEQDYDMHMSASLRMIALAQGHHRR